MMKKSTKRALAFALAGALVATSVNVPSVQAAKLKVSASKKTLYVGSTSAKKKATITVKNAKKKITYKLTKAGKKIIKLSKTSGKKVTVTAKKAGEATVSVMVGKKVVKKITFTVKKYKKKQPTKKPTSKPTQKPSEAPSQKPTAAPSDQPTAAPSEAPTATPSATPTPTVTPSATPTATPSATPTPGGSGGGGGSYVPPKPLVTPTPEPETTYEKLEGPAYTLDAANEYKLVANGHEIETSEGTFSVAKKAITYIADFATDVEGAYNKLAAKEIPEGTIYTVGKDTKIEVVSKGTAKLGEEIGYGEGGADGIKVVYKVTSKDTKAAGKYTAVVFKHFNGKYCVRINKTDGSQTVSFYINSDPSKTYITDAAITKDGNSYLKDKLYKKQYEISSVKSGSVTTVTIIEVDTTNYSWTANNTIFTYDTDKDQLGISLAGKLVDKLTVYKANVK